MTKQTTVLMFGWEFPPYNSGGLGTACHGLSKALSREHRVIFVLPRTISLNTTEVHFRFADEHFPEMKVREVDSLLLPYLTETSYRERARTGDPGAGQYGRTLLDEVALYAKRARRVAETEEYDVIHAHDWLAFSAGIEAKRVSGKPLVVHVHATEYDRTGGNNSSRIFELERTGMKAADHICAVSSYTRSIITEKYGIDPAKISVVHNGIEEDNALPTEEERDNSSLKALKRSGNKIVLYVGRITLQKGPEYFIRAAKRVLEFNPRVIFVIAGSGDMEGKTMREAALHGISKNVRFAGFVRGEDLDAVYKIADLYVMPSVSEPFGLTALEAVRRGTPVLLSKQSGVSEVLKHSLRVDFWDTEEMANKIISVLSYGSIGRELKSNAFQEIAQLTWESAAKKCAGVYRSLLGRVKNKNNV